MRTVAMALLVALPALAGCTPGESRLDPMASSSPSASLAVPTGTPAACGAFPAGTRLVVVGGKDPFNAALYRFEPCTGAVAPAGPGDRYSTVDAAGSRVVVAHAQSGRDAVAFVADGRLEPLGSVGTPAGLTPAVADDGRVAYVTLDADPREPFVVMVWRPGADPRPVYRSADALGPLSWGPDGRLALARRKPATGGQSGGPGTLTALDVPATGNATVAWERRLDADANRVEVAPDGDRVAVSGGGKAFVVSARGTRTTALPGGWDVYAWDEGGTKVLVGGPRGVALATPGSASPADVVAFPPGGVYGLAWPHG